MNPSTEEILQACENLPTDKIIILPNNKNIYLAADSAAKMSSKILKLFQAKVFPREFQPYFDLTRMVIWITCLKNE